MARPEEVESEATLRAITIAKQVDCPLYVVHVTGGEAADIIKTSRMKGTYINSYCNTQSK